MRATQILLILTACVILFFATRTGGPVGTDSPIEEFEPTPSRHEYDLARMGHPEPRDATSRSQEIAFRQHLISQSRARALTNDLDWSSRGPRNVGGRTRAVAFDVTNPDILIAGSTSGGMFRSVDRGETWTKTTRPDQLHSVTSLAQNTSVGNENVWYHGTGWSSASALGGSNAPIVGDGIFKSVDGGQSWNLLPSTASATPAEVDAFDYVHNVATFGENGVAAATAWGIYVSTDGGDSWARSLEAEWDRDFEYHHVAISPTGTWYATIGGDNINTGIHRSENLGTTWTSISPADWPESTRRTLISVAPSDPSRVYFFTEVGNNQQLLMRYDAGSGWTDLTSGLPFDAKHVTFDGNVMALGVKPDDDQVILAGGVDMFRSIDGGVSFEVINGLFPNFHVDQTAIAFDPSNPQNAVVGNDGGVFALDEVSAETSTLTQNWRPLNDGYLTTQFYTVAVNPTTPGDETVIGGTQDNGTVATVSSDPTEEWDFLIGGDGGYVQIADGGDFHYAALAATFGVFRFRRLENGSWEGTGVAPNGGQLGLWQTKFALDGHDSRIMYLLSRRTIWRNSDVTAIPHQVGQRFTDLNWDTFENVQGHYIHALATSPAEPRRLYYAAADDRPEAAEKVFYIENPHEGQPTPVDITGENFPFFPFSPWIDCIVVDPRDALKVMVVFPAHGELSIFSTEDGGQNWEPVSGNLEENPDGTGHGPSVRWASILYVNDRPVYLAGTSVGLFSTTELNGMDTEWTPEAQESIGNVVIDQVAVRQSDGFVAIGTHGNGVYTSYITQVPTTSSEDKVELPSSIAAAEVYPNPLHDTARIEFSVDRPGPITVSVFDIQGRAVAELSEGPLPAGNHSLIWNPGGLSTGSYFVRFADATSSKVVSVQLVD